ncbi:MAG TPA: class I SAM-dependent methyltransferase [Chloroflexota bacterium]|nr:class I SAM-dependent methyltransferase [Chloroflexota bacterium]
MMDGAQVAARRAEAAQILAFGRAASSPYLVHLQSEFSIANYIRIADQVARRAHQVARPAGRSTAPAVLDWGAGYGQLSYLLAGRGCVVTSYDVGVPGPAPLPICPTMTILRDDHPWHLPFNDASFDVVVSCGVLEHVAEEEASLGEIHRVLRRHGLFLIYNLPQRFGYTELLVRAFRLGYTNERRYGVRDTRRLLARHGFTARRIRRSNMLPHNFRGLPAPMRATLTRHPETLLRADLALATIPGLNMLSGILEVVAQRED